MLRRLVLLTWLVLGMLGLGTSGCGDSGSTESNPTNPTIDLFLVNDGSPYTLSRTVSLTVSCSEGVEEIVVSEDPSFAGDAWQQYVEEFEFELSSGDGSKALYACVRDAGERESPTATAGISLAESTTVAGLSPYVPTARYDPQSSDSTTLELWVANATGMVSAVFELSFDPTLLEVTDMEVAGIPGHILSSTGASLIVANDEFDNGIGEVLIGVLAMQDGFQGVTGSGPFARVTFAPLQSLSAATAVEFVTGEWSKIYVYQEGAPPGELDDVLFVDGEVTP
ncbi:MAG: hypothetical protein KAY32_17735 [Candidatus Eisenbacteria sp.]|nr:hypothetical protein [Candidatus Eisenbacteria bacterium]